MSLNIINKKKNQFSLTKEESLIRGTIKRERMIGLIENLAQFNQIEKFPHLYIYSPPGLGKTHTVNEFLKKSELTYFVVSGNTSMFAFGIQLAVIN
jgi:Cdc6-like AAA superfamily ATPase